MQVDIIGRVDNLHLPVSKPHIPLLECLVNSIESIEERNTFEGRIDVHVDRDIKQDGLPCSEEAASGPIKNIRIEDNGAGFDDLNFRAFLLSDSTRKVSRGNKGIGRFTWLKAFEKAEIDSTYLEGSEWYRRTFKFLKTIDGVEDENVDDAENESYKTVVHLKGLHDDYQKRFPKALDTFGRKIIDHLLIHFINGSCPQIRLFDNSGNSLSLNDLFREEFQINVDKVAFTIGDLAFEASILRYRTGTKKSHAVSYCANQREVLDWKASNAIPDLKVQLVDEDGQGFVFRTYVSGPYFDKRVNAERTGFLFLDDDDIPFEGELKRKDIDAAVVKELRKIAEPFLKELKEEKRENIKQFVSEKAPQFRYILNERYEKHLENISPALNEDQLDLELYKTQRDIELEHRENGTKIQSLSLEDPTQYEEYKELYDQYLEEENELGKATLAKYVIHRRTILELFDNALKLQDDGKFAREDLVHNLIYPMRSSSEDVEFSKQNLWLVDERLSYHWYLASDKPLSAIKAAKIEGGDEPDVVVFNTPQIYTESKSPFQSIVVIEFKRPERNEYPAKDEDPVEQVLRYVKKIKAGQAKDKDGKTITVADVPFYAYIICSLTPKIRSILEGRDFTKMPDHEGYFSYHKNSGCYFEVLSFDKVLDDAKKRNRAFFEQLQLPIQ